MNSIWQKRWTSHPRVGYKHRWLPSWMVSFCLSPSGERSQLPGWELPHGELINIYPPNCFLSQRGLQWSPLCNPSSHSPTSFCSGFCDNGLIWIFYSFYVKGIDHKAHILFFVWLLSCSILILRFLHVELCSSSSFLLIATQQSPVWMYHGPYVHLLMDIQVISSLGAITNRGDVSVCAWVCT